MSDEAEYRLSGQPVRQPVYLVEQRPRTNGMAIAALITVFFASVVGLVLGYVALHQIKETGEGGHGLAFAAVVLGWISVGLTVLVVGGFVIGSWVLRLY